MLAFFGAIPEAVSELDRLIDEIAIIHDTLVKNDDDLKRGIDSASLADHRQRGTRFRFGRNWRRNRLILA